MFQSFDASTSPDQGPPRLAALRSELAAMGLDGFLVPRADRHQGEYVAPADERLAWLTGFTGSAGFAAVTAEIAGVFIDGRYRLQVRDQVADVFTPVHWPETKLGPWLLDILPDGAKVGFDPWLHTYDEIKKLRRELKDQITLEPVENPIDRIWHDRPSPPDAPARAHPIELSGERSPDKRMRMAQTIKETGQDAVILTLPDSICWLLNIRGSDIARIPIVQAFAILSADGTVNLFSDPTKFAPLGPDPAISVHPWEAFSDSLKKLSGKVRVDGASAPLAVSDILNGAGATCVYDSDPCILAKARKNDVEIQGARDAHLVDGAAVIEFLAWLDHEAPNGTLTEIKAARKLEAFRKASNVLQEISFDTISGAGPNGAIVHYRVTEQTNRSLRDGELYLVDSGGQYLNGTTDITRTVVIGTPTEQHRDCYTRVLQGMIAISATRFPRGVAGRDLDALARAALWRVGLDYDHGTGHGVGSYLSVHEGPQRLSRAATVPLDPGMILSNEPGYYLADGFGIRIENLIVVREAETLGDGRDQLDFETLTFVPLDQRLIDKTSLAHWEINWINHYHAEVWQKMQPRLSPFAATWLEAATKPL